MTREDSGLAGGIAGRLLRGSVASAGASRGQMNFSSGALAASSGLLFPYEATRTSRTELDRKEKRLPYRRHATDRGYRATARARRLLSG